MANPTRYRIIQLGNNKATLDGYDMPDAEIVARSEKYDHKKIIVLKIPGHKYQYGYSSTETVSYAPAEFTVFEVLEGDHHSEDTLIAIKLISFPVRKPRD